LPQVIVDADVGQQADAWRSQALYIDKRLRGKQLFNQVTKMLQRAGVDYEMGMLVLANAVACATAMHITGKAGERQLNEQEMPRALHNADVIRRLIEERLQSYGR